MTIEQKATLPDGSAEPYSGRCGIEESPSMSEHIASVFDRDLETVQAHIMKMGGLVESSIRDAAYALEHRDQEAAEEVRRRDAEVDNLETLVNEEAARVIALRAPTASDLRTVLTVMKISGNLERIGDYAKNMAKRTSVLVQMTPVGGAASDTRRMAQAVELMLKDALDAYVRRDADLAQDVRLRDSEVDQMYNALFRQLLTYMMEDPRNITGSMHLHFIAKNIERMGDHVTSIADQVIYLVTGEIPAEDRPKGDRTPYYSPPKEGS
jgi:phosphate transport system protein